MIVLMPAWDLGLRDSGFAQGFRERDWHAGWVETSMVMALEPSLVRMKDLRLDPEPLWQLQLAHPDNYQHAEKMVDDPFVVPRLTQRQDIRVGVMGYPRKASKHKGQMIVADIVEYAARHIKRLEAKADGIDKEVVFRPEPILFAAD